MLAKVIAALQKHLTPLATSSARAALPTEPSESPLWREDPHNRRPPPRKPRLGPTVEGAETANLEELPKDEAGELPQILLKMPQDAAPSSALVQMLDESQAQRQSLLQRIGSRIYTKTAEQNARGLKVRKGAMLDDKAG